MPDGTAQELTATAHGAMGDIDREVWDALANPPGQPDYPFTSYDFLDILERSGSVQPETGWAPQHLILSQGGRAVGALPLYLKGHSQGEYIFDHAFADAYERAGGRYYPKLLSAVPFTPATGPRLLARDHDDQKALARAAVQMAAKLGISSLNINFTTPHDKDTLADAGFLTRSGTQYRFTDQGFGDWDGFLDALASRKRKALRKEREAIRAKDIAIDWITGTDITESMLDHFWRFYQDTGARKWGTPYLTRTAFSMLAERMSDKLLLVMARRGEEFIAGAMNVIGGDALYGRYWGCTEHVPFLHFELCYYQAIDYALAHSLKTVDAGAQGEHKIARGYSPVTTWSAHWFADPGFSDAVAHYLEAEKSNVEETIDYLADFTPFKQTP